MSIVRVIALASALLLSVQDTVGHGRLMKPPSRSSAWRFNIPGSEVNYDDTALNCGDEHQDKQRPGRTKCGVCGDIYSRNRPRPNERGGDYGKGMVFKRYRQGQSLRASVEITTAHKGYFEFSVCPLRGPRDTETEQCFMRNPLWGRIINGPGGASRMGYKIAPPEGINLNGMYEIELQLPPGLRCDYCSFRWEYTGGNNDGVCLDGSRKVGCGLQETFRNCADISIA